MNDGGQRAGPSDGRSAARVAALRDARVLDTPREERFDRITRLASLAIDVPVAYISYLDDRRQWFKSAVGVELDEVPVERTVCRHVVASGHPIVVTDTTPDEDVRAPANAAGFRFYAGFPITDPDGHVLGTFCVADHRARELSDRDRAVLDELVALAVEETFSLDRTEAARRLLAGERWFERVTEATIDGLVIAGTDGRIVHVNRAAEEMFGWMRDELVGRPARMLLAPDDVVHMDELAERVLREGRFDSVAGVRTYTGVRRDGTTFTMEVSTSAPEGDDGTFLVFSVRDVSDRVAAYGELERSESRFRLLSEVAPVGIVQATGGLRCVYVNRAWSMMTGISETEAIAQPWTAGIHPDDLDAFESAWADARELDRELAVEFRMLARDGRVTFVVGHAITVVGPDGDVEGHLLTVQDVSVLHETQSTLADAEDLHRRVVDSMTEGVVVQDREGVILAANRASLEILGSDAEDLVGRSSFDDGWRAVRADGSPFPTRELPPEVALAGEPCLGVLIGIERRDGMLRWLRVNSMPLVRQGEAVPWGVASTFTDVTDSLALARMKDEFVSTVSHELRTPLTSIRGALGLLVAGSDGLPPASRRMLEIAESNSRRLVRLIDDILDIERMESGRAPVVVHEADLADLLGQAVETMAAMADENDVILQTSAAPTVVPLDPDRVLQVLTNLLSNAIKFSPPGGTVRVALEADDARATVRISDEGRGVPQDRQQSIFERFEQVDKSDARERGGTGLGLAICKSIVLQHGGAIGVDSLTGHGATFWFELPRHTVATSPAPQRPAGTPGAAASGDRSDTSPVRVLVVEDDADLARVLADLLAERSVEAHVVATVDAARDVLRVDGDGGSPRFDLVLLDLLLPDGDGLTLVDTVRATHRDVPVVAFSALDPGVERLDVTEYHVKGRIDPALFADRIAALAVTTGRSRR